MAKKIIAALKVAGEFNNLFGPPPLLKAEDIVIYATILAGLAQDEKPRSFIARILLRDVADLVYQRLWLGRLAPRLIRQAHKNRLQVSAEISQVEADQFKKTIHYNYDRLSSAKPKADVPNADKSKSEAEKAKPEPDKININKIDIEKIDATIDAFMKKKLTELKKAEDGPVDEAALFRGWIESYEQVQRLLSAVDKRLSDTLKLLDEYRYGLGQRVRQVADEIVDVEFAEAPLAAREQVATPASSAVKAEVPSTREMLPPSVAAPS